MSDLPHDINKYIKNFRDIADLFEFFAGLESDVFKLVIEISPDVDLDIYYKIEVLDKKAWIAFIENNDINKAISEFKEKYNSSVSNENRII